MIQRSHWTMNISSSDFMTKCPICSSSHRKKYEMERINGKTYRALAGMARKIEGHRIKAVAFKKHFEEHHGGG